MTNQNPTKASEGSPEGTPKGRKKLFVKRWFSTSNPDHDALPELVEATEADLKEAGYIPKESLHTIELGDKHAKVFIEGLQEMVLERGWISREKIKELLKDWKDWYEENKQILSELKDSKDRNCQGTKLNTIELCIFELENLIKEGDAKK